MSGAPYEVRPVKGTGKWAVFDARGVRVSTFGNHQSAMTTAEHRTRMSGRRERRCMCCSAPFLSEGAHNRLCHACRGRPDDGAGEAYAIGQR